jgi:hypothetical protein
MLDADRAGIRNLRLVEANAPEVLEHLLPEASVDELWIFFPDPWHKAKHNKRRLIAPPFPPLAARRCATGAAAPRDRLGGLRPADARGPGRRRAFAPRSTVSGPSGSTGA